MRRVLAVFSIVAGLAVTFASAQTTDQRRETNWKQVCERATAAPLPTPSFGHVESESSLAQCNATSLYYGFGHAADPAAALQCAYYQRAHPKPTVGDPFYGPGVLTMLYANGRGVARNYDLAIRFSCENTWAAGAEMEGRVGHLEQLRDTHAQETKFDLCDDAMSGLMEGACESIQQQFLGVKRRQGLDAISAGWSVRVKEAFKPLNAANEAFIAARTRNEVDLSGSGRAAFSLEEEGRLREQFLIDLRRFGKGGMAPASSTDYLKADESLNDAFGQIIKAPGSAWKDGTIKPEGIRQTEFAWLKLRDAWVEFARIAYPRMGVDTVRTQITRLRVHQLQSLKPR